MMYDEDAHGGKSLRNISKFRPPIFQIFLLLVQPTDSPYATLPVVLQTKFNKIFAHIYSSYRTSNYQVRFIGLSRS